MGGRMRKIRSRAYGSLMEELKKDDPEAFDVVAAYVRELQSEQWKLRERLRVAEGRSLPKPCERT
jgi:hypothetical protein